MVTCRRQESACFVPFILSSPSLYYSCISVVKFKGDLKYERKIMLKVTDFTQKAIKTAKDDEAVLSIVP